MHILYTHKFYLSNTDAFLSDALPLWGIAFKEVKMGKYNQIREMLLENKELFLEHTKEENLKFTQEYQSKLSPAIYDIIIEVINEIYE